MTAEARSGGSFLLVLRRDTGAWWRLVVACVLGLVGLLVTAVLAIVVTVTIARLLGFDTFTFQPADGIDVGEMLAANAGLAALIPVSGGLAWLLYGVKVRWLSSTRPGLRWSWLARCVAIATVVWLPLLALGSLAASLGRTTPIDRGATMFVVVVLVTTPLQAAGEEYLFRGLLLQALGATRIPVWLCCTVSGALFATAHIQFAPPLLADRFVLGFALAWLAYRTGGLEAGIAIHAVKNISVLVPAGLLGDVGEALDPTGVTWVPLIIDIVLLSIAVPWVVATMTRRERSSQPQPVSVGGTPLRPE